MSAPLYQQIEEQVGAGGDKLEAAARRAIQRIVGEEVADDTALSPEQVKAVCQKFHLPKPVGEVTFKQLSGQLTAKWADGYNQRQDKRTFGGIIFKVGLG